MSRLALPPLACAVVLGLFAASRTGAAPDAVVFIQVAKGYQGTLWNAPLPGVLPGTSTGSGWVVDMAPVLEGLDPSLRCPARRSGLLIVTNEHVARGATEIMVTFYEEIPGDEPRHLAVPAALVAADQRMDLAILSVEPGDLAAHGMDPDSVQRLRLWTGRPAELERGMEVQALGNPQGLRRVMTTGVISSPQQEVPGNYAYITAFRSVQTDAAINGGNSGGPLLLGKSGEVVGVNHLGSGQNLNFAIPAWRVRTFLRQAACGTLRHGDLRVMTNPVSGRTRGLLRLPDEAGEIVLRAEQGLHELDVILAVTGKAQPEAGGETVNVKIGSGGAPIGEAFFDLEPGTNATLDVVRGGARIPVQVTVLPFDLQGMGDDDAVSLFGAFLERPAVRVQRENSLKGGGLLCGYVRDGSVAAAAGMQVQDVVRRVLLRDGSGLHDVDVTGVASLRSRVAELESAFAATRAKGSEVTLGFEVYNLRDRTHAFRTLRAAGEE